MGQGLFLLAALSFLASCRTTPLPVNDQSVLDRARLTLPDTYPPGKAGEVVRRHPRTESALRSLGFRWNNPRFVAGRHLAKDNEVAWFDREGDLHVTRYTGIFRESGYRIRRYVPSQSGDLEHRGTLVSAYLMRCLYDRPAAAVRYHHYLSSVSLVVETLAGAGIDTLILPVTLPLCLSSNRLAPAFSEARPEEDPATVREALRRAQRLRQKGNPIPTKVTAPASVE